MAVFASPIYFFNITSQLKTVIDRFYARMQKGFHFHQTAMLLNSSSPGVFDAALAMYKGMTAFAHWEDKGIVTISGTTAKGSKKDLPDLKKVYELVKTL